MSTHGPFYRTGTAGGAGCPVTTIPIEGKDEKGTPLSGSLLSCNLEATELELLRTVAAGLGVHWGHDEFGWWAAVPSAPTSTFVVPYDPVPALVRRYALFREDDNGARFHIGTFESQAETEDRIAELAQGGHKQYYFIEPVTDGGKPA